jgi:hypothetical protein
MEIGDLSMKTDFKTMTIKQLRKYILEHREDQEAFKIFMDRIDSKPSDQIYDATDTDMERFSEILKEHQKF